MSETFDITIRGGSHSAKGWKTDKPIVITGGYGGHPSTSRPKRASLTIYEGRSPFQLDVPMLLFRGPAHAPESVENDRRALDNMATTRGENETQHPPLVVIEATFALPIPPVLGTPEWWIEDLKWEDEWRKPPAFGGELTWKLVTVTLLEAIGLEGPLGKKPGTQTPTHRGVPYVVKKGDTLASIAAHKLGDASRWKEIAKLNGIRSNGELKVGKTIYLPQTTSVAVGSETRAAREKSGGSVAVGVGTRAFREGRH